METKVKGGGNTTSANGSKLNQSSLTQHFDSTQKPYTRGYSLAIHSAVVVAVMFGFGFVLMQLDKLEKQIENSHSFRERFAAKLNTDLIGATETIIRQEAAKTRFVEQNDHAILIKEMTEISNEIEQLTERHIRLADQLNNHKGYMFQNIRTVVAEELEKDGEKDYRYFENAFGTTK